DQQIAVEQRRGTSPLLVVERQIAPLPELLAVGRVQAGGAVGAEVDVDPTLLDHGRRRGVTAAGDNLRMRFGDVEDLEVALDAAGRQVEAEGEQFLAVGRGGGDPDLLAPDDGRGPAVTG